MNEQGNKRKRRQQGRKPLHPAWKFVISGLVLFHLTAVVMFPMMFASGQASPAVMEALWIFEPYGRACHLNHGYAFFAPNPGPSHLIDYRVEFDDGREAIEGRLPDLEQHWPRLLYHRHFMLAEHLNADYVPPEPPPQATQQEIKDWRKARRRYETHLRSIQSHLLSKYDADRVLLKRIEHEIPLPNSVRYEGMQLDDEQLYVTLGEIEVLQAGEDEQ